MDILETLTQQVMGGHKVTKEEALWLSKQPLEPLCRQADKIRRRFCQNTFDLCTIINGKSGRCSEKVHRKRKKTAAAVFFHGRRDMQINMISRRFARCFAAQDVVK